MTYLTLRQDPSVSPTINEKRSRWISPQQRIEVTQLAALAFVAHPRALVRIPAAWTAQQKKVRRRVIAPLHRKGD